MIDHDNGPSSYAPLRVLVYSSNTDVRVRVRNSIGRIPDSGIAPVEFLDAATPDVAIGAMMSNAVDVAVLDGEATPCGGMGLAKQLKDELLAYLPMVVITARADDAWLAGWARADVVVSHPIDPVELRHAILPLLRGRMLT